MNKFDKSDMNVKSMIEDVRDNNPQSEIEISKNSNQIGISNTIFSCIMYFSITSFSGSSGEGVGSIIHWAYLMVYIIFASLFFYALKRMCSFSFRISENITIKNIFWAFGCAILAYTVNYNMNSLLWKSIFITSYDTLLVGLNSLIPLPGLIYICILGPIGEELLLRGYILKGLCNKYTSVVALLVSSLIFAVLHLNIVQIINAFIVGVIFGLLYIKTGSIFSCILAHMLNNSIAMFVTNYYLHNFSFF